MSRSIHAHPVERLVQAYLKRLKANGQIRKEQNILTKASKMIGIALHDPCCPPAEEVILGTQENFFTLQLRSLLNGIDVRKHRSSLENSIALINLRLQGCCDILNPDFIGEWDSANSIDFVGLRTLTEDDSEQGQFLVNWGGFLGPASIDGVLSHGASTDKIEIEYVAAIPSGLNICVHLQQDSEEIEGSPFLVEIPGSGTGIITLENLKNTISGSLPLTMYVGNDC